MRNRVSTVVRCLGLLLVLAPTARADRLVAFGYSINGGARPLYMIDPADGSLAETVSTPFRPTSDVGNLGLGFGAGYLWALGYSINGGPRPLYQIKPGDGSIARTTTTVVQPFVHDVMDLTLAFGDGYLWAIGYSVNNGARPLYKIDPATGAIVRTVTTPFRPPGFGNELAAFGMAYGDGFLWAFGFSINSGLRPLYKISPADGSIVRTVVTPFQPPSVREIANFGLAYGGGHLWAFGFSINNGARPLYKIDPATGGLVQTIITPFRPPGYGDEIANLGLTYEPTPSDISLSRSTVAENEASGTVVGSLSTADADSDSTFTYALVNGTGGRQNNFFAIKGSVLQTSASFDYEATNSYSIRVRSTTQGGLSLEKAFTISVADVNERPSPPWNVAPAEGATGQSLTLVLQSSAFSDPDAGSVHDASEWLVLDGMSGETKWDSGVDAVHKTSCTVPAGRLTAATSYAWRVRYKDAGGLWSEYSAPTRFTTQSATSGSPAVALTPQGQAVAPGAPLSLSVSAVGAMPLSYTWERDGLPISGAGGSALKLGAVQPADVGLYSVVIVNSAGSATTLPAIVGLLPDRKIAGSGAEVGTNVRHANGNLYDQVLLVGAAATVSADAGQIVRVSFVDLTDDIVQIELSGSGALSVALAGPTGPALARNYEQPGVNYMKGHAGVVVTGADETTQISIFSVGRVTAVNQALFKSGVNYDGVADLAYVAILSASGRCGAFRGGNCNFFGGRGVTGVYAPGVKFAGPVYVGDINASDQATPALLVGAAADVRITGGDLFQPNGRAVIVGGIDRVRFTEGVTSQGVMLPAQANRARLEQDGTDVTGQMVQNP